MAFELFSDVNAQCLRGVLLSPPSPHQALLPLVMRPYWIQYNPSTPRKMYSVQLRLKIVKEMNQWSISGIFNYYSARRTETMMAAVEPHGRLSNIYIHEDFHCNF